MNSPSNPPRMRRMLPFLSVAFVVAWAAAPATAWANAEIYQKTLKSTCWIVRPMGNDMMMTGSGVVVDRERKLILTNYHVVGEEREVFVFFPQKKDGKVINDRMYYMNRGNELSLKSRVVAIDRKRDAAIVELPSIPDDVQQIEMAAETVSPGDEVQSVGNPVDSGALWIFTSGTVRAVYRKQFHTEAGEHDFVGIETQSPINRGDSGGPVVNSEGKLVGISQSMNEKARLISFCVDISELKALMAEDWKPAPVAVAQLLDKAGLKYTKHHSGPMSVESPVENAKPLAVFVGDGTEYYGKAEVRKIWSLAFSSKTAPKPETLLSLFEMNGHTKMGAWTIEKNAEGEYLLMFCVQIDATASADAVKSAIEYVTKITVAMNKELGGTPAVANNTPAPPQQASTENKQNPSNGLQLAK